MVEIMTELSLRDTHGVRAAGYCCGDQRVAREPAHGRQLIFTKV
jgi:hypothetical protein